MDYTDWRLCNRMLRSALFYTVYEKPHWIYKPVVQGSVLTSGNHRLFTKTPDKKVMWLFYFRFVPKQLQRQQSSSLSSKLMFSDYWANFSASRKKHFWVNISVFCDKGSWIDWLTQTKSSEFFLQPNIRVLIFANCVVFSFIIILQLLVFLLISPGWLKAIDGFISEVSTTVSLLGSVAIPVLWWFAKLKLNILNSNRTVQSARVEGK